MVSSFAPPLGHAERTAKILVVEDEHLVALDLQHRLEHLGHEVAVAHTGEEALARARGNSFDLVLMDIKLNGPLDGIETARMIHTEKDVPVVYVTAYADSATVSRARATEPYGYIVKPFQERELAATVEMALQRHRSEQEREEQRRLSRFLADASTLMATSLDYRAVCRATAELIVPRYADWCLIHLAEKHETIPAFSYEHPPGDPPIDRAGASELVDVIETSARAQVIQRGEATSVVCAPLVAFDRVLGAILLAGRSPRVPYSERDVRFAEDLGQRLGMALENALLYRKAEQAIAMRDDVLAIVSHDLRTPLGAIVLQAESLAQNPAHAQIGQAIVRAAQRMNRLIADLLDASAINAGQLGLEIGAYLVTDLVHDAVDAFRSQAEASSIALTHEVDPDCTAVQCDRDRILQVLSNLLSNALKFTPPGGSVAVSVRCSDGAARFSVADTGRGISADELSHLFEQFWRGQPRKNGAGLGLFIVRGILAAHGSEIAVDTKEGAGARFSFSLPLATASS